MDTVVDLLRAIRSRYELGKRLGMIRSFGHGFHCINDGQTSDWMDQTREEVLRVFGHVASQAGVIPPRGPLSPYPPRHR
ncbi:MAG TPA: hypothetical protein V6C97_11305 [Oculatellaceae cyanobacterium]